MLRTDINKEKGCEIKLLDDELNEITGGTNLDKANFALKAYGVFPREPISPLQPMVPIKPGDKIEDIEKLLRDWKEKWEKRKEEKDKSKNLDVDTFVPPQQ